MCSGPILRLWQLRRRVVSVEPVTLVVTALVAGAAAGVSGTAAKVVTDAYEALIGLVIACFRRGGVPEPAGRGLVAAVGEVGGRAELEQQLAAVTMDEPTVQAARRLLELLAQQGKFQVAVRDSTGVVVGDHNQQTININPR